MRLLVCGAGGMLGGDVLRAAEAAGHEHVGLTRAELDITDASAVASAVRRERPDAVVNCAAYTDVDGAEQEADDALRVNAEGARHVAAAAAEAGAVVLYPSSDYVFDGTKREPYVESDEPAPLSSYGRSKLVGEHETAAAGGRHLIVRASWLFGTGGRNFVETMLELGSRRDEVAVVNDQVGCPTYTGHLAAGLVQLLHQGSEGVHHLAGAGACSWSDSAREIFREASIPGAVRPATTRDLGRPAPRPEYSVLGTERRGAVRLPHWKVGLEAYLAERAVHA